MFIAEKKKRSRNANGKNVKDEKKKKKMSRPLESPRASSSASSQDKLSIHSCEEKTHGVLGVIERTSPPETEGRLHTSAEKSQTSSDGKVKERKKMKKKESVRQENRGSGPTIEVPEGLEPSSISGSCAKKDFIKQNVEKKKKRKSSKLDMEGHSVPKKTKMNKLKKHEDGMSSHQVLEQNEKLDGIDLTEQNCTTPDFDPKEDKLGREGLPKPKVAKLKKPKHGASPLISVKRELAEQSRQSSNLAAAASPNTAPSKAKRDSEGPSKPKKPKFGVAPQNSSQSNSQPRNPIFENASFTNLAASETQVTEESSKPTKKPKKPKFVAVPQNLSQSNSHSGSSNLPSSPNQVTEEFPKAKKPKKPKFGATLVCSQKLSDLAQELGEIMQETRQESSSVEELQIPVIKPKKIVPVFSKTASEL